MSLNSDLNKEFVNISQNFDEINNVIGYNINTIKIILDSIIILNDKIKFIEKRK